MQNSVLKIFKSGLENLLFWNQQEVPGHVIFGLGLSGAKYVEISDLDIIPSASNLDIEYGIYIKPANATAGCQNVKISNCKIILNKSQYKIHWHTSNNKFFTQRLFNYLTKRNKLI